MHDAAAGEDVDPIRHLGGERHVLLDEEDREPLAPELVERFRHLAHHQRSKAFGRLVHEEQVGVRHQRPADGEHLLLAAGERIARVRLARREAGEEGEDALQVPAFLPVRARHSEILEHRERREDAPALRDEAHPHLDRAERRQAHHVPPLEEHPALARRRESDETADKSRLPHAVAPQDRYHFTPRHCERHALQDVAVAVVAMDVLDREHHPVPR